MDSKKEDDDLCKYLIQATPLHPRVLHEIMRLSETGARLHIISKFGNSRTISQLTSMKLASNFCKKIRLRS